MHVRYRRRHAARGARGRDRGLRAPQPGGDRPRAARLGHRAAGGHAPRLLHAGPGPLGEHRAIVPHRLSRNDARRFDRLRRGDRVRVDIRYDSRNQAELVRFRERCAATRRTAASRGSRGAAVAFGGRTRPHDRRGGRVPCTRLAASGADFALPGAANFQARVAVRRCVGTSPRRARPTPLAQNRAALRWNFAAPGAANFHGAGTSGIECGTLLRPGAANVHGASPYRGT